MDQTGQPKGQMRVISLCNMSSNMYKSNIRESLPCIVVRSLDVLLEYW